MLVFWGLIIWLIVLLIRKLSSRNKSSQTDKAVEVLRQRYSQREIDTEEEYKIRQSDHFFWRWHSRIYVKGIYKILDIIVLQEQECAKLNYQYPYYYYPNYTGRTEAGMPMMGMDEMKQMMMEHMKMTQQIKQKVDMIDERLRKMEEKMMW